MNVIDWNYVNSVVEMSTEALSIVGADCYADAITSLGAVNQDNAGEAYSLLRFASEALLESASGVASVTPPYIAAAMVGAVAQCIGYALCNDVGWSSAAAGISSARFGNLREVMS